MGAVEDPLHCLRMHVMTGAAQIAAWKAAIAAARRQQRAQRSKRKRGLATVTAPGMIRINPAPKEPST
jgi:hypothetical protein